MAGALAEELRQRKSFLETLDTLYLGGGTPSLLNENELSVIFSAVREHYRLSASAEITLEANPDDISPANLSLWQSLGINRLSIGCQTFHDHILEKLNRIHRAEDSVKAYRLARDAGYHNISIDLMFGLPEQSPEQWREDLQTAIDLAPEHISAYGLTIEERTVFGHWHKKGRLQVPDEEHQARYYEEMMNTLSAAGYQQYEISNFCKPGYASRHNSSYWQQEKYLGIGPSAHSFDGSNRMWNVSNNGQYLTAIESGTSGYSTEVLTMKDRANEYVMTSIRTMEGIELPRLLKEYQYPEEKITEILPWMIENGWLRYEQDRIFLTSSGKLLADEITLKFFLN